MNESLSSDLQFPSHLDLVKNPHKLPQTYLSPLAYILRLNSKQLQQIPD